MENLLENSGSGEVKALTLTAGRVPSSGDTSQGGPQQVEIPVINAHRWIEENITLGAGIRRASEVTPEKQMIPTMRRRMPRGNGGNAA
jgi:hypothetical protein